MDKQLKEAECTETLTTLNRKRGGLKHKLTSFTQFINNIKRLLENEPDTIEQRQWLELELRIAKYDSLLHEFEELQTNIEILTSDEAIAQQFSEREIFEDGYFKGMSLGKELLSKKPVDLQTLGNLDAVSYHSDSINSGPTDHSYRSNIQSNIKLPTIELPKFNGNFDKWLEFKDTFESLIHSNARLDAIQKYHYLRASLEGSATQVIA